MGAATPTSWARRDGQGWTLALRVQPGAARTVVAGRYGDALRVRVAAPANEGKANAELVRFVARVLDLPRSSVRIVHGERSRTKIVSVPGEADPARLERGDAAGWRRLSMELRGATVALTGASGGLGQAIARELTGAGARLILHGRRGDVLGELAEVVRGEVMVGDLADRSDLDALAGRADEIDVYIGNAGLGGAGPVVGMDPADIDRAVEVNLTANIQLARRFGAAMAGRGTGHLVFIGSLAGKASGAGSALYSATKFGLRGLAIGLRDELAPAGVGVSLVQPGFVRDAGMFADGDTELPPGVGTTTPEAVGQAVRRAIERNQGMVTVAPLLVAAGADFANLAPTAALWVANHTPLGGMRPAD